MGTCTVTWAMFYDMSQYMGAGGLCTVTGGPYTMGAYVYVYTVL